MRYDDSTIYLQKFNNKAKWIEAYDYFFVRNFYIQRFLERRTNVQIFYGFLDKMMLLRYKLSLARAENYYNSFLLKDLIVSLIRKR